MTSYWFSVVTLLAALALGYGILSNTSNDENAIVAERPVLLGYYLKNAVITETAESGAARLRFAADDVTQNPDDNSVSLSTVRIDYLWANKNYGASHAESQHTNDAASANETQHWVLNANHAQVLAQSESIVLSGDVEAHSVSSPHETTLRTSLLNVDTGKEIARSPDSVAVRFDGQLLTGRGMFVDLKNQHVQLHSDVQVHLAANTPINSSNENSHSEPQKISLPGVFHSESSDYQDNVLVLHKVRSEVEPLIEADQARASGEDLANNRIVLSGHVHVELPQKGQLYADVATVTVKQSQIVDVHITGTPVKFQHQPKNSQKVAHGHAKTVDYDVSAQTLRFSGDAWFSHDDFELSAAEIDYNIGDGSAHGVRNTFDFNRRVNGAAPIKKE